MATEVKHGSEVEWDAEVVQSSEFHCIVRGLYTTQDKLAAGGVVEHRFNSQRTEKQVNELLALRSAFRHWYEQEMRARGVEPTGEYSL